MFIRRLLVVGALAAPLAAQQVHVVGPLGTPGADFESVQAAVNGAADGDVIVVLPGDYDAQVLLDDRALVLAGVTGAGGERAELGGLVIRNLGAARSVVVRGFDVEPGFMGETLAVQDCDGPVLVEDLQVDDDNHFATQLSRIERSQHVVLTRSALHGPRGFIFGIDDKLDGGTGLQVTDATVALYDCTVTGGRGAWGTFAGIETPVAGSGGGTGLRLLAGTVLLAGTEVRGGDGGKGTLGPNQCAPPGDGGTGLQGDGLLRRLDATIAGGAPGPQPGCPPDGVPGTAMAFTGPDLTLPQTLRRLEISSPIEEGGTVSLDIKALPLEPVLLLQAAAPLGNWLGGLKGTLAGAPPWVVYSLGVTGPTGALSFSLAVPTGLFPPGLEATLLVDQLVTAAAGGGGLLSSPSAVTLVVDLP